MKHFFRVFRWFVLRHAVRHRWRVLIVVAGIALGAAVFTCVRLAVHASVQSFTASMDRIAGTAEAVLVRPGGRVPETLLAPVLRHPAVASAAPVSTVYVVSRSGPDDPFLLIGIDPILEPAFRSWDTGSEPSDKTLWRDLIAEPGTMIAASSLLDQLGVGSGAAVRLTHLKRHAAFRIIGTLPESASLVDGGRVAVTDMASFQELTGRFGGVDRIDLKFRSGADAAALAPILPAGVKIEKPSAPRDSALQVVKAYRLNLSILSFVSLFVGMFLVYSLVALHGVSRRREVAVLRSIGGSRRLIFFLFLAEGASFGLVGWLAALPVGTALVRYLLSGINETISTLFVRVHVQRLALDPWEILLSFAVTMAVSLLGALLPAREAMQVAPKEALAAEQTPIRPQKSTARLAFGGLCTGIAAMLLAQLSGPIPGYAATFLLFAGFALLSPWLLERMGTVLPGLLSRIGGEPARLGARYLRDSGIRAAVSVAALTTAVALFCALAIMVHSFRHTVQAWVEQSVSGDLFIRPEMAEFNHYRDPIPPDLMKAIYGLHAPVDILPYHRIFLDYSGVPYQFDTIDFAAFSRHGRFLWVVGKPEKVYPALERGEGVLVSEVFANRTGLSAGDRYRAQIRSKRVALPILGVVRDYRTRGGVVFFPMDRFDRRFGNPPPNGARIFFHNRGPGLEAAVRRLRNRILTLSAGALEVTAGDRLRQTILRIFDQTFAVTFVLLVISLVVAGLGIASTLTVLVLERRRQFNTVLAVGGSTGQIRSVIFWEALLMTLAGEAAGIGGGFLLSDLLIFVINRRSFGWTFLYRVDWVSLAVSTPLILAAALLACLPAVRLALSEPPAMLLRER